MAGAVSDHPRGLPRARNRPGPRADPGRARLPLRVRWGRDRPGRAYDGSRTLRVWRGRLLRRARGQPAGVELPAGGSGVRPPDRRRPRERSARSAAAGGRAADARPLRREHHAGRTAADDRLRGRPPQPGRPRTGRQDDRRPGRRLRRGPAYRGLGGYQPGHGRDGAARDRPGPRGDSRIALAGGLPRSGRRPLGGASERVPGRVRPAADDVRAPGGRVTLPSDLRGRVAAAGLDPSRLETLVAAAVDEDLDGGQDVTSVATIEAGARSTGDVVARAGGVVAGLPVAEAVLSYVDRAGELVVERPAADGAAVRRGDVLLTASGPTRTLLTAERTALNFLCRLSGIATATRAWATAVEGTGARIRDTRKTTPLLRAVEKYAVRCGGGVNHRMSLSDEALVKDNHVIAAGGVSNAFALVRERFPGVPVQVEVTRLDQIDDVLAAGADSILLDNMTPDRMREAVRMVGGRATVEASGGLTLESAREVAETGVDYLAVGALTHSSSALDIAFDLREAR
ncbi:MAG: carboxylating nicotinate-nucleotide diphosphorylase [Propionibacteriales bacterium]|nr:carboxylating nicotinate-nucleotide diphosphorylase [Propionibacteriales bacterium]